MDLPIQWTLDFLQENLPPQLYTTLLTTLSQLSTFLTNTLTPLLTTLLDRLTLLLSSSPNLLAISILLILAIVILQILSIIRRILLFWTRLAFRLIFWAVVGVIVSMVWQRGVEKSISDVVVIGGKVGGWVMGVAGVWWREFERAQEMQRQQQKQGGQQGQRGGGYYGVQGQGRGGAGWR